MFSHPAGVGRAFALQCKAGTIWTTTDTGLKQICLERYDIINVLLRLYQELHNSFEFFQRVTTLGCTMMQTLRQEQEVSV